MKTHSEEQFSVKFDGVALQNHEISVRDLAPALLAIGELFDEANSLLNDQDSKININLRATDAGSVDILLTVSQSYHTLEGFFNNDAVDAIVNAKDLVSIIFAGGTASGYGVIKLIKWLGNKKIKKIERIDDNTRKIVRDDGVSVTIKESELQLFQSFKFRKKSAEIIQTPLSRDGISSISFQYDNETSLIIDKSEKDYFVIPEIEQETLEESEITTNVTIVNAALQGGKWKFDDGSVPFFATIEDETFIRNINENRSFFAKDDILKIRLKKEQAIIGGKLQTKYSVMEVLKHHKAAIQVKLPLE